MGTRKYIPSLTVLTKTDLVKPEFLKSIKYGCVRVSAEKSEGIDGLKEEIFQKLRLIRVYTKRKGEIADNIPLMMREGETIAEACPKLHRDLLTLFKYALIWGPSARFPGQKVGLTHVLKDGDTLQVFAK
jgi:hypothetical protein